MNSADVIAEMENAAHHLDVMICEYLAVLEPNVYTENAEQALGRLQGSISTLKHEQTCAVASPERV
jgi:hypothetical protein